ncbi:transcription factor HIVEP3 [Manis pentadactyla]|uniref:transcription factor HIVEP3 n=1 Tax=Manis pentadactyla TaxID=143292 RepID=UPI00255D1454|nr:transcription factor HIVEP3 [Manis pentadactyla]XP_036748658.2 transcription factor HIVEP3 [Manis pentadactyla]XP_036748659.2 transcription factor HIVEP3 [Manis pentadactyla]XP_036748660.2 transcription factor HIVEP3 [Manis pentadactyla]XP_057356074.1 transcription factor HIVEP3 [Manis pentadactyla]XP_057356076.1 transcription factor HIVEP3 [Manis pentadactyla]XP_057356077.1 transcription factor HIVEP3 [Manis pentadactyla]XP_057356078.1 transcription factor HIVEP3 [Manis pentadactyla]
MDPEQSVKGTKKAEGSPRKRLTKGEAVETSVASSTPYPGSSAAATQEGPLAELPAPQPFQGPSSVLREGPQEKTGQQLKPPRRSTTETSIHISQLPQHPLTPAFMSPGTPEHLLEGSTWQLVDPMRPGPSGPFVTPGLHPQGQLLPPHASIIPPEDLPGISKVFVPRPSQVSMKPTEEAPKKERKPQKPGKYICQYCSRPCAKPSVLQKHIRSHTGERPYPCGPCGFSFKTKSNLYKHRKSHAHRIKAGLASGVSGEMYPPGLEMERIPGEEFEEPTEGESTDSEEETGTPSAAPTELSPRPKHPLLSSSLYGSGSQGSSHERCSLSQSSSAQSLEDPTPFAEPPSEHSLSHKPEDTHTIKQKLALRLSERKKVLDEQAFLSPSSKGSTESGYFSRSESAEQQVSPPNTNARSYAEIIFGKCGRIGQRTAMLTATCTQPLLPLSTEDKPSLVPLSVPRTQVIEHITKLITINEAVVDTSEIDSVKPRRSSLSRRSSMESPKSSLYREPLSSHSEKTKPEQSLLSLQHPPSTTPPVPLLRSHSMPSATCTLSTPHHTFRGSYSFDDHITDSDTLSRSSQVFTSHPRMLKRQPAIELPLGGEYSAEEAGPSGKDTASKPAEEPDPKESELTKKTKKGLKTKGVIYECNICGARYKKRDNYEAHKKYYCSELQIAKPVSAGAHASSEAEKSQAEHEPWSQMMHYKLGTTLELTPLRKRRKEKSLGDEEEPPAFESTKSQFGSPGPSDAARNLPLESTKSPADPSKSVPSLEGPTGFHPRTPKPGSGSESGKERRATSKEISVIQHTSSFEKSDSLEQLSGLEGEDKSPARFSSPPPAPHGRPAHSLQPKLVRQPNIQVPEILVTEEPDRPDTEPEPPPKDPEKTEEFQWPQRSQTLAQLPAEKLPPKKKRLRLAEMAQSSGESSFESSMPLSRSPSQESSVSLSGSSHSTSFERDDHGKVEAPGPSSDTRSKPLGTHMLTVPSHHPHAREMRRSASEQSPNVSLSAHMTETRSKSFDYGSLSLTGPSVPAPVAPMAPVAPAALPERRKCFLVRQASLSRPPEMESEAAPKGRQESEEPKPSSSKPSPKGSSSQISSSATSHSGHPGGKGQMQDRPPVGSTPPYTEALQVLHHPIAQLPLHEKPYLTPPVSHFSFQHLLQHEPGQPSEFFSTQAMSSLLSAPYSMPPISPSLFQAPPLPLQPTVLHPSQLHLPQLMPPPANIPYRQPPSFLPMPYPASSALSSGFFLPLQSQFALQLPGDVESHLPEIKTSLAPLATGTTGLSSRTEYSSDIQLPPVAPPASCSAPTSDPPLAPPTCPGTMVSLVVPVRIQTDMPSYGSAMYTTLSQILVTQSQGSPATMALPKFEEPPSKGTTVCGADVYEVGPGPAGVSEEQNRGFLTPYLRVPVTIPERKDTSLSSESVLNLEGSSSTAGGSKRVLSPAGSLELTMETQQQKRVKEEEASKADEKLELVKPCSVVLISTENGKKPEKSHLSSQDQGRRELETLPSLSSDPSDPKEIPTLPHPSSPHVTAPGSEALKEYAQSSGKPHRRGLPPLSVKKEDSKEQPDLPPLAPPSSLPLSETSPRPEKSQEGTDSKKVLQFPSLHTTTNVSWCYLNYIKPNHIQHADRRSSVYAGWCISLYNPNLPGVSTKAALSLLRSKQKVSKETYTMATAPHPETGRLVPSSSRKPRMTEVHLPSLVSPEGHKDIARVEKEDEKRGKPEEDAPASKRGEPARIKIFEGGYKSNEEYVYVRGRGRGKYVCEECGIRCKKPSMLKKHIRTHTDVRPYVCKHCHFAFKTKGNLTKHMKSKAHSKKCQETGVLEELEAEEGTSDDPFQDSEGREGSEAMAEHQFSDLEDSDSDSDLDEDEDEDEESQDELLGPSSEAPPPGPRATLPVGSSPVQGPQPPDATSGSQATRGSLVSEAEHLAAGGRSMSSQSTLCLPPLEPAPSDPMEKNTGSALSSKAVSPRRPWSPSKEAGSRPSLAHKHSLVKSDSSPQRHSPTRESQASVPSPPGLRTSRLPCGSPRLELSLPMSRPLGRELPPRAHLPAEREGATDPGLPRHLPTGRLSPGQAQSPPQSELPGKWALAGPGSPSAGEHGPGLGLAPRALHPPVPLPHMLLGRSPETCTSLWKAESRSPSCSPGPAQPFSSRPFSAPHDFHGHIPARTEENIFSHLPLHSQHLPRAPCPLIPIGGIQMVQTRPGAHPTLLPGPTTAWISGFSGGGSDLTGAREAQERGRWSPTEGSSASVSPVAKVSKFTLSLELESRDYPKERQRTGGGLGRPPDWEPCVGEAPAEPVPAHGPRTSPSPSPRPPHHHRAEPWSPRLESPHTPASPPASASPPLDRSSSVGCLVEASTHFPARRRNLSGEPRTSQGSSEPSGSGGPRVPPHQSEGRGPPST